jgi:hypothetical protein
MSVVKYKVVFDFLTGDVTNVPLTEEEIAENTARAAEADERDAQIKSEAEARELARESAREKLSGLGLTQDEVEAIVGA